MVKVRIDLTELEIQMLLNCIKSAIDTKHMPKESIGRIKEIEEELSKYLLESETM